MYITMMPLIIAGILNMVFTKTKLYQEHKNPIDGNRLWKDGKRIFGDHKTWIGFLSMVIICGITQIAWGVVCQNANLNLYNDIYDNYDNTLLYNTIIGLITGFGYMIAELPNSFVKRRLDIASGKTDKGLKGMLFFIIDQIDSLIGIVMVLYCISDISFFKGLGYIFVGAFTHVAINSCLYVMKVRKNI